MTPSLSLAEAWLLAVCILEFCWHARRELAAFGRDAARLLWAAWRET